MINSFAEAKASSCKSANQRQQSSSSSPLCGGKGSRYRSCYTNKLCIRVSQQQRVWYFCSDGQFSRCFSFWIWCTLYWASQIVLPAVLQYFPLKDYYENRRRFKNRHQMSHSSQNTPALLDVFLRNKSFYRRLLGITWSTLKADISEGRDVSLLRFKEASLRQRH